MIVVHIRWSLAQIEVTVNRQDYIFLGLLGLKKGLGFRSIFGGR